MPTSEKLSLDSILYLLENHKKILVGIELGQHRFCDIASNCPLAIQIRRVMLEAKVSLDELVALAQVVPESPWEVNIPEVTATLDLYIGANSPIKLDVTALGRDELSRALRYKMEEFQEQTRRCESLGTGLHQAFVREIQKIRTTKQLPQLTFDPVELIRHRIIFTSDGVGYIFLFHFLYNPQYAYSDGIRYSLKQEHIQRLMKEVFLKIFIKEKAIYPPTVSNPLGKKFQHYHGDMSDCWGQVAYPRTWDGSLKQLVEIKTQMVHALTTVNLDSMMLRTPPDMPTDTELRAGMKRIGREGEISPPATTEADGTPQPEPVRTRATPQGEGWGARRRI